jgi:hypothetical protein
VRALAFHPRSRFVASGGADGLSWLWDADGGKALVDLGLQPSAVLWATFRQGEGPEAITADAHGWVAAWSTRTDVPDASGFRSFVVALCAWLPDASALCPKATSPGGATAASASEGKAASP